MGKETGGYSAAVVASGNFLFVSGHGPMRDGSWLRGTVEEETIATLENLVATIEAAGAKVADIVRCGCYLADIDTFGAFDKAYRTFFGDKLPARTTIGVALSDGIKVEIDAIVCLQRTLRR